MAIEQIKEDQQVKDFIYGQFHYDKVLDAIKELIQIIAQDEETNEPILEIKTIYSKKEKEWWIWAILANGTHFRYMMYIDEDGRISADGW